MCESRKGLGGAAGGNAAGRTERELLSNKFATPRGSPWTPPGMEDPEFAIAGGPSSPDGRSAVGSADGRRKMNLDGSLGA